MINCCNALLINESVCMFLKHLYYFTIYSYDNVCFHVNSGGHTMMVFSGGMPRASYGDHHTVTAMHGTRHVVFDFTSKVVDFFTICSADEVDVRSKYGSFLVLQYLVDIRGYDVESSHPLY